MVKRLASSSSLLLIALIVTTLAAGATLLAPPAQAEIGPTQPNCPAPSGSCIAGTSILVRCGCCAHFPETVAKFQNYKEYTCVGGSWVAQRDVCGWAYLCAK